MSASFARAHSWWQQLAAMMIKEAKEVVRDPSSWIIAVVPPLTFLFLFGYGISLDTTVVVAVVREDDSRDAQNFAAALTSRGGSWSRGSTAARGASAAGPDRQGGGTAQFGRFMHAQTSSAQVQVLVDGAEPNTANFVQRLRANAIWSDFLASRARQQGTVMTPLVDVEVRYWYNANAESRWFLIPGSMTVIMTLLGTLLLVVIAREWERGTLETCNSATPLTRGQILIGKTLPYFLLAMVSMLVCVLTALILFHLPLRGLLLALALVSAVFRCGVGQGLLISVTMKSQMAAAQLGLMTGFMPAMMLSGFLFDIHSMPARLITLATPCRRHTNISLQTISRRYLGSASSQPAAVGAVFFRPLVVAAAQAVDGPPPLSGCSPSSTTMLRGTGVRAGR